MSRRIKKASSEEPNLLVCCHEDRVSMLPQVEVLARSLRANHPELRLTIYSPLQQPDRGYLAGENVRWIVRRCEEERGWNVKPGVLLDALGLSERVLWLDSDIVIANPMRRPGGSSETLIVGQEFRGPAVDGGFLRAAAWGLETRRSVPFHVNSGTLLVSRNHEPLLRRWRQMLNSEAYVYEQRLPVSRRAVHMVGDQDALWALLCSAEFSHIDFDYFRNGADVIQDSGLNGYHWRDRIRGGSSVKATFVHALGWRKPWEDLSAFGRIERAKRKMLRSFSPYCVVAATYASEAPWTMIQGWPARLLVGLSLGRRLLPAIPLAMLADFARWLRPKR